MTVLTVELATFESHKTALLATDSGRFVLIKGADILGIYDTENDAIDQGYDRLGNVAFLVKKIVEFERPVFLTHAIVGS